MIPEMLLWICYCEYDSLLPNQNPKKITERFFELSISVENMEYYADHMKLDL